jgi:putative RNA 2'-phosphotransferase
VLPPRLVAISKTISWGLRHQPAELGVALDPHGWTELRALLDALAARGLSASAADLEAILAGGDKQRFELSPDGTHIRAMHGHTVEVEPDAAPVVPPDVLFHGTVRRFMDAIRAQGLLPMARRFVHLTADEATALEVARRRGKPVLLEVRAASMVAAGHVFYRSASGVWLTATVPVGFFQERAWRADPRSAGVWGSVSVCRYDLWIQTDTPRSNFPQLSRGRGPAHIVPRCLGRVARAIPRIPRRDPCPTCAKEPPRWCSTGVVQVRRRGKPFSPRASSSLPWSAVVMPLRRSTRRKVGITGGPVTFR